MTEIQLTTLFCQSDEQGTSYRTIKLDLDKPIFLNCNHKNYVRCAIGSIPYSFCNISADLGNNTFTITATDGFLNYSSTITLDDGTYPSLLELQNAINFKIKNGPFGIIFSDPRDYIILDANTTTGKVVLTVNSFNLLSFAFNPSPSTLYKELGLLQIPYTSAPANVTTVHLSNQPVLFNDFIANGIMAIFQYDSDLQCFSYYQNVSYSSILNQFLLSPNDIMGSTINLTEQASSLKIPITENKNINKIRIAFVSPRNPQKQILFTQGNASLALTFTAIP